MFESCLAALVPPTKTAQGDVWRNWIPFSNFMIQKENVQQVRVGLVDTMRRAVFLKKRQESSIASLIPKTSTSVASHSTSITSIVLLLSPLICSFFHKKSHHNNPPWRWKILINQKVKIRFLRLVEPLAAPPRHGKTHNFTLIQAAPDCYNIHRVGSNIPTLKTLSTSP